ncbi:endonuclease domain-containing protein [Dyella caseinilytica]|uniref:endonuclease domain-containing protein n=1 Tax=Dyella caseinilytica TaxID=1849581 RepID=UPI001E4B9F18|nr:endonuclease domain-containing protein [Dyella caseinilytica]
MPTRTREQARHLRQTSTEAERELWYRLRGGRLNGHKFRRQHPIPPYVADFYCDTNRLVIELDGSQHDPQTDKTRTLYLEAQGLKVLRFWDNDVLQQMDAVLEVIFSSFEDRTLTPTPLPRGEGLTSEER